MAGLLSSSEVEESLVVKSGPPAPAGESQTSKTSSSIDTDSGCLFQARFQRTELQDAPHFELLTRLEFRAFLRHLVFKVCSNAQISFR